jgi:hypothetical protein
MRRCRCPDAGAETVTPERWLTRVATASRGTVVGGVVSNQLKPGFRSLAEPESSSYTSIIRSILTQPVAQPDWRPGSARHLMKLA